MFHFPDKILETMTCDSCYKFLSVWPVKVYPNRKTKCGRCSHFEDGGVVSKFGLVAEQVLFKCVNRFDGCRQLLRVSEVPTHESACQSKVYVCPICPGSTAIETFLLMKHFEESHKECLLESASFKADVSFPHTKIYLYEAEENLFFIEYSCSADAIRLRAIHLSEGSVSEDIKQKFIVNCGSEIKETEEKECATVGDMSSGRFFLAKPKVEFVIVYFHLSVPYFHESKLEKKTCLPRMVSMRQKYLEFAVELKSTLLILRSSNTEILLHCLNCSKPHNQYLSLSSNFLRVGILKLQWICSFCKSYYQNELEELLISWSELWKKQSFDIYFSCIWRSWGCSEFHDNILEHEIDCPHQPPQLCPVAGCSFREKLCNLSKHFKRLHTTHHIEFQNYCYINAVQNMFPRKYFLWSNDGFVSVEIANNQLYCDIEISVQQLDGNVNRNSTESKVVVLDQNYTFLGIVTDKKSIKTNSRCFYIMGFFDNQ